MLATLLIVTLLVSLAMFYTIGRNRRCRHDFVFVCGIYGDQIHYANGKRSVWQCACGKRQYREELINPLGSSAPYFWPGLFEQQQQAEQAEEERLQRERLKQEWEFEMWLNGDISRTTPGLSQSLAQLAAAQLRGSPRSDGQRRYLLNFLPDLFPRL